MFAVVGLGNPGSRYETTRHNLGAVAVRQLAERICGPAGSGSWQRKDKCEFLRTSLGGEDCILVLPQDYMNLSGHAVQPLLGFYKVVREQLVVVHDELDLEPGVIRLKRGGSAAGNRGVQDVAQQLGGDDFYRVRIGIGHPRILGARGSVSDWVLSEPGPQEQVLLEKAVSDAGDAVCVLLEEGLTAAQQRFHNKKRNEVEE